MDLLSRIYYYAQPPENSILIYAWNGLKLLINYEEWSDAEVIRLIKCIIQEWSDAVQK